ncbi:MAG: leucine-rich repeat protein [Clostridia bacterium]|nr:leucine-rich repeat protein [Clostridia bacterium]
MINKQIKKISIFIMLTILLGITLSFSVHYVLAEETENEYEEKTYSNLTVEDDFDDSCVLVVMDKNVGGINKIHSEDFFGDIDIESIEDLTYIEGNFNELKYLDQGNFRQILKINLSKPSKENVLYAISVLEGIEGIKHAGPNYYDKAMEEDENSDTVGEYNFWNYFGENGIHLDEAWRFTTGSSNVKVGVIDSGVYEHQDLKNNLDVGLNCVTKTTTTNNDTSGHGTLVASIIGAKNQEENGYKGVCPNVKIVPFQVVDYNEKGEYRNYKVSDTIRAISYAITYSIPILNYSATTFYDTTYEYYYSLREAALNNYNGLFIVAAGNETTNLDSRRSDPACYANDSYGYLSKRVITVGALNENGARRENSNYGQNTVSIYAPGQDIIGANYGQDNYRSAHGTSYAAPHVAGVAALMLSLNPNLTAEELKAKIIVSAEDITISTPGGNQNVKKLNAYEALKSVVYEVDSQGVLTNVNVPEKAGVLGVPTDVNGITITEIGDNAFSGCTSLTSITIPSSVTSIGLNAFSSCSNLASVNFAENCQLECIYGAFLGCSNLTSITIPSSVISIGQGAFAGCIGLQTVEFEENSEIEYIGDMAFNNCTSLGSITIPQNVFSIGYGAFWNCTDLQAVMFEGESELTYIDSNAFKNTAIEEIIIPQSVQEIGVEAFWYCDNLTTIRLLRPSSIGVTNCYFGASENELQTAYPSLEEIIVPNEESYEAYKEAMFIYPAMRVFLTCDPGQFEFELLSNGTYMVSNVADDIAGDIVIPAMFNTIPVTVIANNAFMGCTNITCITIPSSITTIGTNAFGYCSSLTTVYLSESLVDMDGSTFMCCYALTDIIVPNIASVYYAHISNLPDLASFIICDSGQLYFELLYNGTYAVVGATSDIAGELIIPAYYNGAPVTAILDNAFAGCDSLTYVELPYAITTIGAYAFSGCISLEDIVLPSSVINIDEYAFEECENLGVVALLRTAEQGITQIDTTAFYDNGLICFVVFDEDSCEAYKEELNTSLQNYVQYVMYL